MHFEQVGQSGRAPSADQAKCGSATLLQRCCPVHQPEQVSQRMAQAGFFLVLVQCSAVLRLAYRNAATQQATHCLQTEMEHEMEAPTPSPTTNYTLGES
eukprot:1146856-Pelagomonas_calceolata.AAC.1